MSNNRLMQVLLAPRVTEKTTRVGEQSNQYVFKVVTDAEKSEALFLYQLLGHASGMINQNTPDSD